jgi:hypothetical protein
MSSTVLYRSWIVKTVLKWLVVAIRWIIVNMRYSRYCSGHRSWLVGIIVD